MIGILNIPARDSELPPGFPAFLPVQLRQDAAGRVLECPPSLQPFQHFFNGLFTISLGRTPTKRTSFSPDDWHTHVLAATA
jgi:hypothetical protein